MVCSADAALTDNNATQPMTAADEKFLILKFKCITGFPLLSCLFAVTLNATRYRPLANHSARDMATHLAGFPARFPASTQPAAHSTFARNEARYWLGLTPTYFLNTRLNCATD